MLIFYYDITPCSDLRKMNITLLNENRFDQLLSSLSNEQRKLRISQALAHSNFQNEADIRDTVRGKTNPEVTTFFQQQFPAMDILDASALAGLLFSQGDSILFHSYSPFTKLICLISHSISL